MIVMRINCMNSECHYLFLWAGECLPNEHYFVLFASVQPSVAEMESYLHKHFMDIHIKYSAIFKEKNCICDERDEGKLDAKLLIINLKIAIALV